MLNLYLSLRMESLIKTESLYRYYGDYCAVEDLSFELKRGEVLGLLGPNGAGKTTTLRMIAGNLAPSAGSIRLNGVDLLERPLAAKAGLGYLPENPPLYREMTVDEYLRYCARLHRIPRRDIRTAVVQAKARCGLETAGSRLIANLSKGYQQRVGIAQAIIHNPAVVILDEPTVGLDPIQIREIRDLIRELGASHGVILSTHILPEVQSVCSRVQILHRGRLVYADRLESATAPVSSLVIQLERPPKLAQLSELPEIEAVQALEPGRYRLQLKEATPNARTVAEWLVSNGWGLHEFTPERQSLEQIFVRLTAGEVAR